MDSGMFLESVTSWNRAIHHYIYICTYNIRCCKCGSWPSSWFVQANVVNHTCDLIYFDTNIYIYMYSLNNTISSRLSNIWFKVTCHMSYVSPDAWYVLYDLGYIYIYDRCVCIINMHVCIVLQCPLERAAQLWPLTPVKLLTPVALVAPVARAHRFHD